jgi:hypothetical protein
MRARFGRPLRRMLAGACAVVLLTPAVLDAGEAVARRGGGGRGRVSRSSSGRAGFSRSGSRGFSRGRSRPTGGWSRSVRMSRPAMTGRPVNRRPVDRRVDGRIDRSRYRHVNSRNWNRRVTINNVNVRPGWARVGWGAARPWRHGWYGDWRTPSWGWWGTRAAAWGIGTLATAAIINNAVDNAVSSGGTTIVVPSTDYDLLYGTVQPTSASTISFAVSNDGSTYQMSADCSSGLLNGSEPTSAAEAELLNAACQVAFGEA